MMRALLLVASASVVLASSEWIAHLSKLVADEGVDVERTHIKVIRHNCGAVSGYEPKKMFDGKINVDGWRPTPCTRGSKKVQMKDPWGNIVSTHDEYSWAAGGCLCGQGGWYVDIDLGHPYVIYGANMTSAGDIKHDPTAYIISGCKDNANDCP